MDTIGLISAVPREAAATVRAMGLTPSHGIHLGMVAGQRIVSMVSGMGARRIETAFDDMVSTWGPTTIIHLGYAGGLDPALAAGEIPAATRILDAAGDPPLHLSPTAPPRTDACIDDAVTLLSTHALVDTPQAKDVLHRTTGATMVDMESYAVARRAAEAGVVLRIFRAIVDTASMALPPGIDRWVNGEGRTQWRRLAQDLAVHPTLVPAALRLGRHARTADATLQAKVVECVVTHAASTARW